MRPLLLTAALAFSLSALLAGCTSSDAAQPQPAAAAPKTAPAAATTPAAQPAPAAAAKPVGKSGVARVVFVDKEKACECTQKAIDASWTALQSALGTTALPVDRIHLDTQAEFAATYKEKKPMVAVPGIYFLTESGSLVELLQGTVTVEQISAVLK